MSGIRVVVDAVGLRERTTEVLRDAILSLHFAPGEKLVERRLCEETGVSRTCVREALRALEAEGLVDKIPNRGIRVHEVGIAEAEEIYETRGVLESAMARRFVERAGAEHLAAFRRAVAAVEATLGQDMKAYVHALDEVSDAMMRGAQNTTAHRLIGTLNARITYLRAITSRLGSVEEKRESLALLKRLEDALVARDGAGAEQACKAYVSLSAHFAARIFARLGSHVPRRVFLPAGG